MKLVPYDRSKLKIYKPGRNQAILLEFVESGLDCVKVEDWTHKNAKVCQSNLGACALKLGLQNSVRVVIRKGEVFLVRKDKEDT